MPGYFILRTQACLLRANAWRRFDTQSAAAQWVARMFWEADKLQPFPGGACALIRDETADRFVVAYMFAFPREFREDRRLESLVALEQLLVTDPLVAGEALLMFASNCLVPGLTPASGRGTPWPFPGECGREALANAEARTAH